MNELLFGKPVFHTGVNITVRDGTKWEFLRPGDELVLCDVNRNPLIKGRALLSYVSPFEKIPECWHKFNHDPDARTVAGIEKAMHAAYGDVFGPLVTVIWFEVFN